jgi:hypothetical protein
MKRTEIGARVGRTHALGHRCMARESVFPESLFLAGAVRENLRPAGLRDGASSRELGALVAGLRSGSERSFDQLQALVSEAMRPYHTGESAVGRIRKTCAPPGNIATQPKVGTDWDADMEFRDQVQETTMIIAEAILCRALSNPRLLPGFIKVLVRYKAA